MDVGVFVLGISSLFMFGYNVKLISGVETPRATWLPFTTPIPARPAVLGPCAIALYGLPRGFKDLVLPTFIENVMKPNSVYECDYFVHYYDKRQETMDRGDTGRSGTIRPEEIKLLEQALHNITTAMSTSPGSIVFNSSDALVPAGLDDYNSIHRSTSITFTMDSEESFWKHRGELVNQILTSTNLADGTPTYLPAPEYDYTNTTVINIIKMWHSQQAVWELLEHSSSRQKHYSRIAVLRSDVVWVTPIDIYSTPDFGLDTANQYAVIPGFANFPVNDRMIYGPYDAVRIWSSGRFRRLEQHVQHMHEMQLNVGIHSERFLYYTLFPAIRDAGIEILTDNSICFLRARADMSIRIADCGNDLVTSENQKAIEYLIQRPCIINTTDAPLVRLECNDLVKRERNDVSFPFAEWDFEGNDEI